MKLYSERQVQIGSFLGGPLSGGIFMAHNARVAGQERERKKYLLITALATIGLFAISFALPERKSGNYLLPLLVACAMQYWYKKTQGDFLSGGRFPGAAQASWWEVVGLSLLFAIVQIVLLFAAVYGYFSIFPPAP